MYKIHIFYLKTTDISAFHSKLASHRIVLKVLSVFKKHCLQPSNDK